MKTKSLILALAVTSMSFTAFAQKYAVTTAKEEYDKYAAMRGTKSPLAEVSLKAAMIAIDKAVLNDKTKEDALAWAIRAQLYSDVAYYQKSASDAAKGAEAVKKATALDVNGENKERIKGANQFLYYYQIQKGKSFFDEKNYPNAYTEFSKALDFQPNDTTANYASGLAAMYQKDYPKAIERYKALLPTNYSQLVDIYSNLSIMYAAQKDTAGAIAILSEGAAKFPNSTDLATREIEFSLMTGKQQQVINKIAAQSEKNPTNRLYPFYLGIAYSALLEDKKATEATKKDAANKAEEAYKKAISIDPSYADAYINLGGLIMNNGIVIYNKANKVPSNKVAEYNALKKQAMAEFDRALPFLDKATQLDPKSELALKNLQKYYSIKNNTAKAAEIDAKIKALK